MFVEQMNQHREQVEVPRNIPSRVIFEITQYCPFRCNGCLAMDDQLNKGPTKDDIITIGKKCVDAGVSSISWTGGEPFIRKDFLPAVEQIVKYDSKYQTIQTVDTNGVFITPEHARISAQLFKLARVSIHGSEKTFRKWANPSENIHWEQSFHAIELFLLSGLRVQVNIPVYEIDDMLLITEKLFQEFGASPLIEEVVFIPRINPGQDLDSTYMFPSYEQISPYIEQIRSTYPFSTRLFIWKPGKHFVIKADGKAYAHPVENEPNGLMFVGNPLNESIINIWNKFPQEFVNDHRKLTPDVSHLLADEALRRKG